MAKKGLDKTTTARIAVQEIKLRRMAQRAAVAAAKLKASTVSGGPKSSLTAAGCEVRHTRERGHGITYERKAVLCGKKGCAKLHGPYWYAFWTAGGRVRSVYIGKTFQTVEAKCPERLAAGGA
jgi:hypothetical protein